VSIFRSDRAIVIRESLGLKDTLSGRFRRDHNIILGGWQKLPEGCLAEVEKSEKTALELFWPTTASKRSSL
jgi:hypothetical protein